MSEGGGDFEALDWRAVDWLALATSALFLVIVLWALPSPREITTYQSGANLYGKENHDSLAAIFQVIGGWSLINRDYIDVWSTFAIALFTATLFFATYGQLRHLRRDFISANRPRIILRESYIVDEATLDDKFTPAHAICTVTNIGASNGRIVKSKLTTSAKFVKGRLKLPEPEENEIGDVFLKPGATRTCLLPGLFPLGALPMGRGDGAGTYLVGKIIYRDDLGVERQTAFVREYDPERRRFYPVDDDQLNYVD